MDWMIYELVGNGWGTQALRTSIWRVMGDRIGMGGMCGHLLVTVLVSDA